MGYRRLQEPSTHLYVRVSDSFCYEDGTNGRLVAMLHFPEVMKKGQAELDQVIGHSRMPEFDDKANLPYISAIINEALRFLIAACLDKLVLIYT